MMHAKNQFWAIVLGNKPIVHLGKISFGLYVYHFFGLNFGLFLAETLRFAPQQTIWFPLIILLSGFIVTFSCAEISYRFLETPFLNLKQRFTEVPSHPV